MMKPFSFFGRTIPLRPKTLLIVKGSSPNKILDQLI